MSLLSAFLDNLDNSMEDGLSFAALRSIGNSVVPLNMYNLGERTHIKFGWNCATYPAAVSIAKRYVVERFEGISIDVIRPDDLFERSFVLSFIRND